MEFDAVILAGGRSSRLGGAPKARFTVDGATLLERTLRAARGARRTVVVGPDPGSLPRGVLDCREDPPFSGPAAAIAAGLRRLAGGGQGSPEPGAAPLTLVLACDMPHVAGAVRALLEAGASLDETAGDGVLAVSPDGRTQPLVGLYGTAALERAIAEAARRNALAGGSVFSLLASLELRQVPVPPGSTDDVDTWEDAAALGAADSSSAPPEMRRPNSTLEANGEEPG